MFQQGALLGSPPQVAAATCCTWWAKQWSGLDQLHVPSIKLPSLLHIPHWESQVERG
jgi:hypothetical protein